MNMNKQNGKNQIRRNLYRGILILCGLVMVSCSVIPSSLLPGSAGTSSQESNDILIPVTRGSISSSISFIGNVQYSQSTSLTWKTAGVIDKVYVNVGDTVKKGDILAVLATDSLSSNVLIAEKTMIDQQENLENVKESELAKMQAYVNLNSKESALKSAKLKQEALYYPRATQQEMERAWDSLALANLNFNYAKQDYDALVANNTPWEGYEEEVRVTMFGRSMLLSGADSRSGRERKFEDYVSTYNTLVDAYETYVWTTDEPSATDYAVAEGNVQVAQMEYDQALEEYLSYEDGPREKDIHLAEVSLNTAETTYNQRFITASFDGTVTAVNAVEGYYVTRGSSAVRIDDMSRIYIPISIPELDVASISVGTPVTVTVDAVSGTTYTGRIISIDDAGDSTGNAAYFNAKVEVDSPDSRLLAGMTAEVSMTAVEKNNVLLIPNTAISYSDGKPHVTVVQNDTRETVEVTMGLVSGNISEITSGNIREDAQVVVSSISRAALTQLGLDPSEYLGGGQSEQGGQRMQIPQMPGAEVPQSVMPTAARESEPAADVLLTETEGEKPAEVPATATAVPTAVATEEPTEAPVSEDEQQMPLMMDNGEFPAFPGGDMPNMDGSDFPMNFGGQRPGGDGSDTFRGFSDSEERPDRSGTGGGRSPQNIVPTSQPSETVTESGEKG